MTTCMRLLAVLCLLTAPALAQPRQQESVAAATARANANTVAIVSGGIDGTYARIAADLSAVLDDGDRLRVLPILGKGSVQNITDILLLRGIDLGIVQADVMTYVRRQKLFPGIEQSIQYVAKLYDEEVHILARRDIAKLEDLAGQPVNVDVRGSGTAMTASVMFESLGIPARLVNENQATALDKLKRGEIAALVYVAGKPATLFSPVPADSGLHFLPVPMTQGLVETYLPARLEHAQYPALIPEGQGVDTLAVGAVLAVYGWAPPQDRYARVARFVDAFFSRFAAFRQPPRHPKWREVNLSAQLPGWTRFPPAAEWLKRQADAGGPRAAAP